MDRGIGDHPNLYPFFLPLYHREGGGIEENVSPGGERMLPK
jgi:hypothetical protein